ncbi:MAG: CRISPR-associated ring nuclease Csm6 [Thiohalomonadaceae bacterium]
MNHPTEQQHLTKHILLCVTGMSPQIITETLYALAVEQSPPFVPDEIHLITTSEGAEYARLTLLDSSQGQYHSLCREYGLDASKICFDDSTIHLIGGATPLDDIRSIADNEQAADDIIALVQQLTADPLCTIHASIAGGRKTMGFYLGYAFSLFGRPQDRISHVLVSAPFESHREFFYPPKQPRVLRTRDDRPISTKDARITLAQIPFVRLREQLGNVLPTAQQHSFKDLVRQAQLSLSPAELVIDTEAHLIRCNDYTVPLRPTEMAFITWLARLRLQDHPGISRMNISTQERDAYLTAYSQLGKKRSGDLERIQRALKVGMDEAYFDQRRANLHKTLKAHLGQLAPNFYVQAEGKHSMTRYSLKLEPEQIRFAPLDEATNTQTELSE